VSPLKLAERAARVGPKPGFPGIEACDSVVSGGRCPADEDASIMQSLWAEFVRSRAFWLGYVAAGVDFVVCPTLQTDCQTLWAEGRNA
jgi:hypothetical protein